MRLLEAENKNLKETVRKLENKLEMLQKDVLENNCGAVRDVNT